MRFTPARTYLSSAAVALGLAAFSGWCALKWWPALFAGGLFLIGGLLVLYLAMRPAIEVTESGLHLGKKSIPWSDIRRVDQTGWISPMVVDLTLVDHKRTRLIYPGDQGKPLLPKGIFNGKHGIKTPPFGMTDAILNPHHELFRASVVFYRKIIHCFVWGLTTCAKLFS